MKEDDKKNTPPAHVLDHSLTIYLSSEEKQNEETEHDRNGSDWRFIGTGKRFGELHNTCGCTYRSPNSGH
jgi:hypothetical protein